MHKRSWATLAIIVGMTTAAYAIPSSFVGSDGWDCGAASLEYSTNCGQFDAGGSINWHQIGQGGLGFGAQIRLGVHESFPLTVYVEFPSAPIFSLSPNVDVPFILRLGIYMGNQGSLWVDGGLAADWFPTSGLVAEGLAAFRLAWFQNHDGSVVGAVAGVALGGGWPENGGGGGYYVTYY